MTITQGGKGENNRKPVKKLAHRYLQKEYNRNIDRNRLELNEN